MRVQLDSTKEERMRYRTDAERGQENKLDRKNMSLWDRCKEIVYPYEQLNKHQQKQSYTIITE